MVLEYLPGGTLEDRLQAQQPLPDDETHRIATEVAAALAHAHAHGLVHRDLKPANILFDAEDRAKIADFGIARLGSGSGTITEAGTVLGTAAYISPEQAVGDTATPASDVYSFGVILYRMLTGRLPFVAEQPLELLRLHRDVRPPPLDIIRPDAPADLAALAVAALEKDPAARPRGGAALLTTLGGMPTAVAAAPTSPLRSDPDSATAVLPRVGPPPEPPRRRMRPGVIAALVVLLAAGGGALAYAVTRPNGPTTQPTLRTTIPHRTLPKLKTTASTHAATTAAPPPTTTEATTAATTTRATTHPATTAAPPPTTAPPPPPTTTEATTTEPPTTTGGISTTVSVGLP
jgi:serine/threonine-protein kinase